MSVGWKGVAVITAFSAAVVSVMLDKFQVPHMLAIDQAMSGNGGQKKKSEVPPQDPACQKEVDPKSGLQIYKPNC